MLEKKICHDCGLLIPLDKSGVMFIHECNPTKALIDDLKKVNTVYGWINRLAIRAAAKITQLEEIKHKKDNFENRIAIYDVLNERIRQIELEGWSTEHDDKHEFGELACAAAFYATAEAGDNQPDMWPFSWTSWKPKSRRSNLVRAAALIIAEIERLDRKQIVITGPKEPPRQLNHKPKA